MAYTGFSRAPKSAGPPVSDFKFNLDGSGNNAFGAWDDGFQTQDYLKNLLGAQYPGAMNAGYFTTGWAQPNFERSVRSVFDMLTPAGARARTDAFGRAAQEDAATSGRNTGDMLGSLGYGKATQGGALIDAGNQARAATGDFYSREADPMSLARQRASVAQGAANGPGIQNVLQMLGMGKDSPGSPTLLQSGLGLLGGLFGGGWNPFSDRRLKRDVRKVGERGGLGVYEYTLNGARETGYMADEVLKVRPDAVSVDRLGYMHVDYDALGGRP